MESKSETISEQIKNLTKQEKLRFLYYFICTGFIFYFVLDSKSIIISLNDNLLDLVSVNILEFSSKELIIIELTNKIWKLFFNLFQIILVFGIMIMIHAKEGLDLLKDELKKT